MTTEKVTTTKKTSAKKKVGVGSIRKRAQEIFLKRTEEGATGDADSDWLQAEEELKNQ